MRLPALRSSVLLLVIPVSAVFAADAQTPRYIALVNRANHSVVSLQFAAHGQGDYTDVMLDAPLRGGGESETVALRGASCRLDLRFGFADGRALRYEDVDVCRYGKVAIRPLPRGSNGQEYVVRSTAPAVYAEAEAGNAPATRP
ncbi:MAG TPA: hypothetical protein VM687_08265 [Stenotrophomonas sp.]|nr:hypothetical protein [Stenotrophomonas sp.]